MIQIDKTESTYNVNIRGLNFMNAGSLWLPSEQRFMVVGGSNFIKNSETLRSAFLVSSHSGKCEEALE